MGQVRPRFTIRRLMIVVAIVGIGLGGAILTVRLTRRATSFRHRADLFAQNEALTGQLLAVDSEALAFVVESRKALADLMRAESMREANRIGLKPDAFEKWLESRPGNPGKRAEDLEASIALRRERLRYYSLMRRKYERAAARPWERIEPDLP